MGHHTTISHRFARIAAAMVGGALAATALAAPASSESTNYTFEKSPYLRSVTVANNAADVVVTFKVPKTPKAIKISGWNVNLDTVAGHQSDFGAMEFAVTGFWKRDGVQLWAYFDDGSFEQTEVACDGLRTVSRKQGRVKKVFVPRFCLTLDDVTATAVRAQAGIYGTRKKPDGTSCWGVGAPRKGWTAWLDPEPAAGRTAAHTARAVGAAQRGC